MSDLTEKKIEFQTVRRIDSNNASSVEQSINEKLGSIDDISEYVLVFDAKELEYISSAGLRMFLSLRKKVKDLVIINTASQVYDIFSVTGFTEVLTVKQALRELSVEGCEKLAEGANGVVYILDPETIIKVYKHPVMDEILNERNLSRSAFVHGIPTAISYDIVKVGETYGTVFEFLNATSLTRLIKGNPDKLDVYVKMYVDLLKTIHGTEISDVVIPSAKEIFNAKLLRCKSVLDEKTYLRIQSYVNSIKDERILNHGDYHTNNILIQNGEPLLIDMDTLCYGNIDFEFANIFLAYKGFCEVKPEETETFFGFSREFASVFYDKVLKCYFGTDDVSEQSLRISLLGYIRLLIVFCGRRFLNEKDNGKRISYIAEKIESLLTGVGF